MSEAAREIIHFIPGADEILKPKFTCSSRLCGLMVIRNKTVTNRRVVGPPSDRPPVSLLDGWDVSFLNLISLFFCPSLCASRLLFPSPSRRATRLYETSLTDPENYFYRLPYTYVYTKIRTSMVIIVVSWLSPAFVVFKVVLDHGVDFARLRPDRLVVTAVKAIHLFFKDFLIDHYQTNPLDLFVRSE